MGTITASNLFERASIILHDTEATRRWPHDTELLLWLNDGQREAARLKPDVYTQKEARQLSEGTRQPLPDGAFYLVDIPRNMGTDGLTPGRKITPVERWVLDELRPDWHTEEKKTEILHYTFDARNPDYFFVWPPSDGQGYVEALFSAPPTDLGMVEDTISIDDKYAGVLLEFILYRAFLKDADYAGSAERAGGHYQNFLGLLGMHGQAEVMINPNVPQSVRRAAMAGQSGGQQE